MYKKEWYARTFLLKLIENISFAAIPQKAFHSTEKILSPDDDNESTPSA